MNSSSRTTSSRPPLAIDGGPPVRTDLLPYGRQAIDDEDVAAVVEALRSDWLTTGPRVAELEQEFAAAVGAPFAVAVSSGTAALHVTVAALGIGPGAEVIVPALTFAASANCVVYCRATPVFADVDPSTLLVDPDSVAARITPRTRAVIAVDYAGQPCDYTALTALAEPRGIAIVADACHALGARDGTGLVGSLARANTFSLHPVKGVTTGEGGVVTTADEALAGRIRTLRNHGITADHRERQAQGSWFYEMVELGFNYRLTDFQCALGASQLRKLPAWVARRRQIAARYDRAFAELPGVERLRTREGVSHAYHLYVVRFRRAAFGVHRDTMFSALRAEGLGVNVHYVPVHLHPFYRQRFGTRPGQCPVAEAAHEEILTLPLFPAMTEQDVEDVIAAVGKVVAAYAL